MAESISQYPMVDKFLRYLQVEKNTSPLTVKNYAADISLFSNFLAERLGKDFQWQKIGVLDIRAYLALLNKEKYARTTIARRISSLRSFYKFLMRENYSIATSASSPTPRPATSASAPARSAICTASTRRSSTALRAASSPARA